MEVSAIVELYWQRREQAITESDKKYGKYCRSSEDTEECLNDIWLSAWIQMPDKRPNNLDSFLSTICRNSAINRRRSMSLRSSCSLSTALRFLFLLMTGGYLLRATGL